MGKKEDSRRNERIVELKYDDHLKKMPEQSVRIIQLKWFYIKRPKFWSDDRKIVHVTKVFRNVTLYALTIAFAIIAITAVVNDKKQDWNLHTFNQDGEIQWIEKLTRLHR